MLLVIFLEMMCYCSFSFLYLHLCTHHKAAITYLVGLDVYVYFPLNISEKKKMCLLVVWAVAPRDRLPHYQIDLFFSSVIYLSSPLLYTVISVLSLVHHILDL